MLFLLAGEVIFRVFNLRSCKINLLSLEKDLKLVYNLPPNFKAAIQYYFSNQIGNSISQINIGLIQIYYSLLMQEEYLSFA